MKSIWWENADLPSYESLDENKKTDVLIIGGGIAGVLCAYFLHQAGVDYVLLEASTLCSGITKNTTAKITSQHGLLYHKLIKEFGVEKAGGYLKVNQAALESYRRLCAGIDCDFQEKDSFVYATDSPKKIEKELTALGRLGFGATLAETLPLPFPVAGAVRFRNQAQFQPLKFVGAIASGLHIYEHTPVRELARHTAITDRGKISAEKIIVATHFPFLNKHGAYFIKLYQHRSYVVALNNAQDVQGMYVDEARTGLSFRNYENLLLLGGGGHRTGKQGGGWWELEAFARRHYPQSQEIACWATQDCMTLDGVPYIGEYSSGTHDLYVATGFNKWGMTSSMVAATLLTDLVLGRKNEFAPIFAPNRKILRPQLAVNGFEATASLLTPAGKRCPHLGCALKWNSQEHSWDCPCHGSRFTKDGKLIDNPATGNLRGCPELQK